MITPTAPDVAGKAFVGWYDGETKFEDFNTALTITETKTRTITAKYENALYVYFYNPEGTQIMRTEKVGDHDPHGYTDVSYDVDSTHKLVGWAAEANGTKNIADSIAVPKGSTSVNVYAIIKEGHWVTFDSNGGSAIDSQFVLDGNTLTLNKSTTPTKPGYEFVGWYDGLTKVEDGSAVTTPMTLKARWEAAQVDYTINYWQQKVTDDKNATDAQKTYEYVEAETKKETTGTKISATNSKKYKGFTYNANNSSKDVEISGDGTTIINVYYDRVLCRVNFYAYENSWTGGSWKLKKYETGLYGANLPEGTWDSSKNLWFTKKSGGSNAVLLTSFDFETAGYANNQGNESKNDIVTTCNFYAGSGLNGTVNYYNEQSDGTFKLVQTVRTNGESLNVHEKYEGYELYRYSTGSKAQETAQYWEKQNSVKDSVKVYGDIINIASKLKTYSLSYYNYNGVANKEENIKYTASLESYANYTPEKPSGLPEYYEFGGWYKDEACTTKFDFSKETMPNANLQIYAKWTAKKIKLTYNLNTPDGTSMKVNRDVDAGTIASTVLPSATPTSDYSFAGWYYADGNENITKHAFNVNEAITKDTNVIGKWLYNGELTVVYDPGEEGSKATVPTDSNIYAGGAKVTVAKNATTTSKKKFLGWELNRNLYYPGDAFEVNKYLANNDNIITLKAIWGNEESSTTMSYDPGNGRGDKKNFAVKNNESVTLKSEKDSDLGYQAPKAEDKEYYFAGWATSKENADNGKATYAAGQIVHVDVKGENVLYATWIEKTVITVKAKDGTATYDGIDHTVSGFEATTFEVNGNKYTVTGLSATVTGKDAGNYTNEVTGTAVVKDAAGNNVTEQFTVKTENGSLDIAPKSVTVTAENKTKVFGEADPELTATVAGTVGKDKVKYDVEREAGEDVGHYSVIPTGEEIQGNYKVTYKNGDFEITKAGTMTLTPELTGKDAEKVYDGQPLSGGATATVKEGTKITYSTDGGETWSETLPSITDVGTLNVTAKAENKNYEDVTVDYTLTVKHRKVTVTGNNGNKVYGEADPELTATVAGTVGKDKVKYDVEREAGEDVGHYSVIPTGE